MKKILTIGRYFKSRFGQRVRKIPISLQGFTCPNIDGSVAKGGCIYCRNESFSPSIVKISNLDTPANAPKIEMNFKITQNPLLENQVAQLKEQFKWHSEFHKNKFEVRKYLVYFQSYTNTYAPFDTLKRLYQEALALPNVVGMSIGTRVDCVEDRVLDLLGDYVKKGKEIWLEYGIQSVYDETLKATNRGHSTQGMAELFKKTRQRGIKVCAHLIYGLPKETPEMMLHSLKTILQWGVDGLKIHPLYVVSGTYLEKLYLSKNYTPIALADYADLIVASLKIIPTDVVVQRVSAGAHDETLLAPKWCFDKNIQMRYLREKLKSAGIEY
ncbi:TIGR01212 family radical SAM protein [Helicobacter sp. 11S02596-1]|uniref:TIGR01212 family radical SAM protein n=1 Tax=Helicobacter sp. 11S02596-1 TaxID=1476194 RepID=UPI000BA6D52F|nr:TIGR01212 family radical SAM protein [Helicobacter sp. 11S02596-1]PAF45085.1 TIGR01212 family radical SAM protein [Helicobacter sp. 11S02596-1]